MQIAKNIHATYSVQVSKFTQNTLFYQTNNHTSIKCLMFKKIQKNVILSGPNWINEHKLYLSKHQISNHRMTKLTKRRSTFTALVTAPVYKSTTILSILGGLFSKENLGRCPHFIFHRFVTVYNCWEWILRL